MNYTEMNLLSIVISNVNVQFTTLTKIFRYLFVAIFLASMFPTQTTTAPKPQQKRKRRKKNSRHSSDLFCIRRSDSNVMKLYLIHYFLPFLFFTDIFSTSVITDVSSFYFTDLVFFHTFSQMWQNCMVLHIQDIIKSALTFNQILIVVRNLCMEFAHRRN